MSTVDTLLIPKGKFIRGKSCQYCWFIKIKHLCWVNCHLSGTQITHSHGTLKINIYFKEAVALQAQYYLRLLYGKKI